MALKSTKSKINSNPKKNSPLIVGEGDAPVPKSIPIEQLEVKNPNIVPNVSFVLPKPATVTKPTFDDVPIQRIVRTSKLVKSKSNDSNTSSTNLTTEIENTIRLKAGNARTVRAVEQPVDEPRNPIQTNASVERPFRKAGLADTFSYGTQSDLPKETISSELVPESKVLALMDMSKLGPQALEELITARRLESDVDDKLLRSLISLMEQDKTNADYIYSIESEIRDEIAAAESVLNTMDSFDSLIDYTRNSLLIGRNRNALHESFLNQLRAYGSNVSNVEEMQATFENDFIKVFENLNAMEDADGVDPQFLVWKNLESISDTLRNGVSNRYLSEQSASGFSLEYLNFDYDGSFSSFQNFSNENEGMQLAGFDPLERIFYYITCMCNELNQSIGLGTLQALQADNSNGDDWLRNNVGVQEDLLSYEDNVGFYSSMFVKDPNDEIRPLMRLGLDGAFQSYLTEFKSNVKNNTYQNYESGLFKVQQDVSSFQNNVLKLINMQEGKKKLLEPKNLFKRIFEAFDETVSDLNQNNINSQDEKNKNKLLSLAFMHLSAGNITGNKLQFKYEIFNRILLSLKKVREERQSNDLKMSFNYKEITLSNFLNAERSLQRAVASNSFNDFSFKFSLSDFRNFLLEINNSNFKNDVIFHKVLEIFLELEKECIDIINKKQFKIEFLNETGDKVQTKFSNLDASKFCYMIYEVFAILTQTFLQFSIDKNFKVKWNVVSDEIKESLKAIPKAIEKDDFQPFFDSFQTITANDNIGMLNNVYGGMVTAQSFYELNESFKKEQATIPLHLASIQTVIENFRSSTIKFSDYTKILRGDASIQESKLTNEQKNLRNFLNTEIGERFFDDVSKLRIARARLRLMKLKSLSKPFDLAAIESTLYDALMLYIKANDHFATKNHLILTSVDQSILRELVSLDYSDRFKMKLNVTKVNELKNVLYAERSLVELPMGYCLTKDLLDETVQESESKGLNVLSSLSELVSNVKFFDMSNHRATSEVEQLFGSNANNDGKRALLESYLAASLVEVIARIDVDMPGTFKNDVGYNVNVARKMLDMAGAVLGIDNAFEAVFKVDGNELNLRDRDEVQRTFRNEANIVSEKGTVLQLDDGFDYAKFDLMHTLLDTIYFRKGKIKQMVFSDNSTAQVFGIAFDPEDFAYENDFTSDDDNEVRFDSLYLQTEFLQ